MCDIAVFHSEFGWNENMVSSSLHIRDIVHSQSAKIGGHNVFTLSYIHLVVKTPDSRPARCQTVNVFNFVHSM